MAAENVYDWPKHAKSSEPPLEPPGGGGDNGNMEARLTALEQAHSDTRERLVRIETRLESICTKSDMHEALHALTWKLVAACAGLVAAVYFIATKVH